MEACSSSLSSPTAPGASSRIAASSAGCGGSTASAATSAGVTVRVPSRKDMAHGRVMPVTRSPIKMWISVSSDEASAVAVVFVRATAGGTSSPSSRASNTRSAVGTVFLRATRGAASWPPPSLSEAAPSSCRVDGEKVTEPLEGGRALAEPALELGGAEATRKGTAAPEAAADGRTDEEPHDGARCSVCAQPGMYSASASVAIATSLSADEAEPPEAIDITVGASAAGEEPIASAEAERGRDAVGAASLALLANAASLADDAPPSFSRGELPPKLKPPALNSLKLKLVRAVVSATEPTNNEPVFARSSRPLKLDPLELGPSSVVPLGARELIRK